MLQMEQFGISPSSVKVWSKTPYCDAACAQQSAMTTDGSKVDPNYNAGLAFAKAFGLSMPAGYCGKNQYLDKTTGQCADLEQPQTIRPGTLTLTAVKSPILSAVQKAAKFVFNKPALKTTTTTGPVLPVPGVQQQPQYVVASPGMSTGGKVLLGLLGLSALGGSIWYFSHRNTATPNRRRSRRRRHTRRWRY